jgi:glycosyltransferase involved in cell wall biosynthesis
VPRRGGRSRLQRLARDLYLRWFYRHVDAFCYIGAEARQHLCRLGIPETRMFFAPYSVDTALFEAQRLAHSRSAARRALGIAEDQLVLLFSGKLIPRKAPLLFVEAVRRLRGSQHVVVVIVGDGELRPAVTEAGTSVLGDRLRLAGFVNQSQLGGYYAAADVFVLPSHYETWGLVVNEAMQFGLPAVVSSAVGCRRDLVLEGRTGMVFEQGDAAALAACLQRFVDTPGLAQRLGAAARQHIAGYSTAATVAGVRRALGVE